LGSWRDFGCAKQSWHVVLGQIKVDDKSNELGIDKLSLMSGLLTQGMNPGAALAFLIAGPTTTLPAMAAVWGLTTRRVFFLYISFVLVGAII